MAKMLFASEAPLPGVSLMDVVPPLIFRSPALIVTRLKELSPPSTSVPSPFFTKRDVSVTLLSVSVSPEATVCVSAHVGKVALAATAATHPHKNCFFMFCIPI